MEIRIYQINLGRDKDCVTFMNTDYLQRHGLKIDATKYDKVFDGSVACNGLEDIFNMFNTNHTADYRGRSLSVSDIVEIVSASDTECGFYFCDSVGFKKVSFDSTETSDMVPKEPEKAIKVVLLEPNKLARITDIDSSLEGMQKIVGGTIEAYYPFEEEVCCVCNEEGKVNGLPLNRAIYGDEKKILDIVAGTAFICDCSGDNFGSLSEEQLKKYEDKFHRPEHFIDNFGDIEAIPFTPAAEKMN